MQTKFLASSLAFLVLNICTINAVKKQNYTIHIKPGSTPNINGTLKIISSDDGGVIISGQVTGLSEGLHGFHIHEHGILGENCSDVGDHYNPFQNPHGHPKDKYRHAGDLGNIEANKDGVADVHIHDELASMDARSDTFIGNRSVVIHERPDDLGRGNNSESKLQGNAGPKAGCGLIEGHIDDHTPIPADQEYEIHFFPGTSGTIEGTLDVLPHDTGVIIVGKMTGMVPGRHGFHIHEKGDLRNHCLNAGLHFNPYEHPHGDPKDKIRHVGDLGNIEVDHSGTAYVEIHDEIASLDPNSENYIGNLSVVIHEKPDDMGRGHNIESKIQGNAGQRRGCGRIMLKEKQSKNGVISNFIAPVQVICIFLIIITLRSKNQLFYYN